MKGVTTKGIGGTQEIATTISLTSKDEITGIKTNTYPIIETGLTTAVVRISSVTILTTRVLARTETTQINETL